MAGTHATFQQTALVVPLGFHIAAGAPVGVPRSGCPLPLGNAHSGTGGHSRAGGAYARAFRTLALHSELRSGRAAIRRADCRRPGRRGPPPPRSTHPGNRRRVRALRQRPRLRGRRFAERHAGSLLATADSVYHGSRGKARRTQAPGGSHVGRAPRARPEADPRLVRENSRSGTESGSSIPIARS